MKNIFYLVFILTSLTGCTNLEVNYNLENDLFSGDMFGENGQLFYYKNNPFSGKINSYYSGGKLEFYGNFKNGKPHGDWIRYYENGNIFIKQNFVNGFQHGTKNGYYENGNPQFITEFDNGKQIGEFKSFYENGNIESEVKFKNGLVEGEENFYFENGFIKEKKIYKSGDLNGEYILFHNPDPHFESPPLKGTVDDKVSLIGNYIDGKKEGEFIRYSYSGYVIQKNNFKYGKLHGMSLEYHPNQKLKSKKNYNNGKLNGEFQIFDMKERVIEKGIYSNGLLDGFYHSKIFPDYKVGFKNKYELGKQGKEWIFYNFYESESNPYETTSNHFSYDIEDNNLIVRFLTYDGNRVKSTIRKVE